MNEFDNITNLLTLENADSDAQKHFRERYAEGNEHIASVGYPLHDFFNEHTDAIVAQEGLIDEWMGYIVIATFANGVAAGDGRKTVTGDDVEIAAERICDEWPRCLEMREEGIRDALSELLTVNEE